MAGLEVRKIPATAAMKPLLFLLAVWAGLWLEDPALLLGDTGPLESVLRPSR